MDGLLWAIEEFDYHYKGSKAIASNGVEENGTYMEGLRLDIPLEWHQRSSTNIRAMNPLLERVHVAVALNTSSDVQSNMAAAY